MSKSVITMYYIFLMILSMLVFGLSIVMLIR
jgi:hypothetical protein